jgi:hypothetical protein
VVGSICGGLHRFTRGPVSVSRRHAVNVIFFDTATAALTTRH